MPDVLADGCRLSYAVEGPAAAPVLLLSNALGTTRDLWRSQLAALTPAFRVVRYDTRGHGESESPPGEYTLDRLGRDALAVLDAVGAARAHVCGVSLGGLTAMWLGLHAPERVDRLVLANTAARIGDRSIWDARIDLVRSAGLRAVADAAPARWFTEDFRARRPDVVLAFQAMLCGNSPDGYTACCSGAARCRFARVDRSDRRRHARRHGRARSGDDPRGGCDFCASASPALKACDSMRRIWRTSKRPRRSPAAYGLFLRHEDRHGRQEAPGTGHGGAAGGSR